MVSTLFECATRRRHPPIRPLEVRWAVWAPNHMGVRFYRQPPCRHLLLPLSPRLGRPPPRLSTDSPPTADPFQRRLCDEVHGPAHSLACRPLLAAWGSRRVNASFRSPSPCSFPLPQPPPPLFFIPLFPFRSFPTHLFPPISLCCAASTLRETVAVKSILCRNRSPKGRPVRSRAARETPPRETKEGTTQRVPPLNYNKKNKNKNKKWWKQFARPATAHAAKRPATFIADSTAPLTVFI